MTTYSKEYSDNSHVWMTPVSDYAPMMIAHGCTFADFEAKHPRLAQSEYGQDLKATLDHLSNRDALVVVDEKFVPEDTTEDTKTYLQQNISGTWWSNLTTLDCSTQYGIDLVNKLNEAEENRGSKARYRLSFDGREYNPLAVAKVIKR